MTNWHPKTWPYDEEPDPDYDRDEDYDLYEQACEERAEYERENE